MIVFTLSLDDIVFLAIIGLLVLTLIGMFIAAGVRELIDYIKAGKEDKK